MKTSEDFWPGYIYRGLFKSMGYTDFDLQRPVVGVVNTWSELNPGHYHLRQLAEAVKRGIWSAGGTPLEFNTISVCEMFVETSSLPYRNLIALDTEAMVKAQPLDAAVLLSSCDKNVPAQLMGCASANIPSILVTGGPMLPGRFRAEDVVCCTDGQRYEAEWRAGRLSDNDMEEFENCAYPGIGACGMMGTANTMQSVAETLGMTLPGCASIPAVDAAKYRTAEESGRQVMTLLHENVKPSDIMTLGSFENAIKVLMAIGGSTNAVIHLIAIARQLNIEIPLETFDKLSRETPFLVDVKPSGKYTVRDLFEAGGVQGVMKQLSPLLDLGVLTVTTKTLGENLAKATIKNPEVIHPLDRPIQKEGGIAVLRGNLSPDGAVIKQSAASQNLLTHQGPALVFDSWRDARDKLLSEKVKVTVDHVLVLRNVGPRSGWGMPEYGPLPIPPSLLKNGVRDIVRITDGRMSGGAYGTIVVHVSPEAAIGGPLAAVQDGDIIGLDVPHRKLEVKLTEERIRERMMKWRPPKPVHERGYLNLFASFVEQAPKGCVFPFM